jgi:Type I restriction-modification system methyltransferase subunit
MTISTFNFSSEVDVNILGHIFENSIGEIEELKADEKGRRKKDGIFYTPEDKTDYICRNTIIPYLSKSGKSNTVNDLMGEYWGSEIEDLYEKVKNIKIVDPACGSGAFLNKASDILLEIHEAIHKEQYKDDKTLMPYFDNIKERRSILLNNIYGVDLNEESVEITKLSLFLKVCRKGLKLPNLDQNIKCGNSLIDDPKYTDKPFNWEYEFYEIFEDSGFDIVIGNPPYVRQERIKDIKIYLKEKYDSYTGVADLYVYFFEKGLHILKIGGNLGYISSNKFIKANYGKKLRKLIMENASFKRYVDHTWDKVFEGATVHSSIFILKTVLIKKTKF